MSAKLKMRKCTICHRAFGWNGYSRCICNECKEQGAPGTARKRTDRELFVAINHKKQLKVS